LSTPFVVIPAYNEGSVIGALVRSLIAAGYPQVVVVDDGSTDDTAAAARAAGARVLSHRINRGAGAATETGLEAARHLGAEYTVTMDGDGQHYLEDIPAMIAPLQAGRCDVVIGSRFRGGSRIGLMTRLYNQVANVLTFVLSGTWVSDSQSGMRSFSRRALEAIHIESNGYEFCSEMFSQLKVAGLSFCEVPIRVHYSDYSRSKGQNFINGVETVFRLIIRSLMK
jgi:glycosyltransferase involved in cell wall biosynthesis